MWEKSQKHLALALLFIIAMQPTTGWVFAAGCGIASVHLVRSTYHAFKGE